jgi:hypothetical protein
MLAVPPGEPAYGRRHGEDRRADAARLSFDDHNRSSHHAIPPWHICLHDSLHQPL